MGIGLLVPILFWWPDVLLLTGEKEKERALFDADLAIQLKALLYS